MNIKMFKTIDEVYKEEVLIRLDLLDGNKSKVAKSLGITEKTLYNKLHEWDLVDIAKDFSKGRKKNVYIKETLPRGIKTNG